jgi:hypothetical protein
LRPHFSRVFTGARRWLWQEFSDPDKANGDALRRSQTRVSRQLWHLGKKIMEVDAFIRAHRTRDIREVHPELVFLRLNGGKPLPRKKSEEGDAHSRLAIHTAALPKARRRWMRMICQCRSGSRWGAYARLPVNGKLPIGPMPISPVMLSPETLPLKSSVSGIGLVMDTFQARSSPSTVPSKISVELPSAPCVPVSVPPELASDSVALRSPIGVVMVRFQFPSTAIDVSPRGQVCAAV